MNITRRFRTPVSHSIINTTPILSIEPPFVSEVKRIYNKNGTIIDKLVVQKPIGFGFVIYSGRIFINRYANVTITPDLIHIMYKEVVNFCGVNVPKYLKKHYKNYPYTDVNAQHEKNDEILNDLVLNKFRSAKENSKNVVTVEVKYNSSEFPNYFIWDSRNIQTNWITMPQINALKGYFYDVGDYVAIDNPTINIKKYILLANPNDPNLFCLLFNHVELTLKAAHNRNTDIFFNINSHAKKCFIKYIEPLRNGIGNEIDPQQNLLHFINEYDNLMVTKVGSLNLNNPLLNDLTPDQYTDYVEDEIINLQQRGSDITFVISLH
jgi:hypothetical protein